MTFSKIIWNWNHDIMKLLNLLSALIHGGLCSFICVAANSMQITKSWKASSACQVQHHPGCTAMGWWVGQRRNRETDEKTVWLVETGWDR